MGEPALRFAGMFRELGPVGLDLVQESIFDNVSAEELPDVDEVVRYLRGGYVLIDMMDLADDPFDSTRQIMNGSTIRTDGDWLWRDDLAYHVHRHRVALPDEFLALIRERRYTVPHRDEELLRERSLVAEELVF
ncbi:hypothetical protein F6X68_00850 [Micromonospora sp. AMSO12t]|uniref:hypothetical protein n=1 Tax=Micromonospora sp. AMSO12t TaxID=2650410 RepID=UPI00124B7312|nr:hypothetical protein [Micromonospora sp. AMSO12t]KAB1162258.1 hypothetical protein F6X68_00850 [Micromonospora sp. AMSO12t]